MNIRRREEIMGTNATARGEGHRIAIEKSVKHGATWVVGTVDEREVVALGNGTDEGWTVSSSATLPRNLEKAKAYVECMRQAFESAHIDSGG